MARHDIERLFRLCEQDGFDISVESETQGLFHITAKPDLVDVNVKFIEYYDKHNEIVQYTFSTNYTKKAIEAGDHLAKCLEDYLNKSQ